MQSGADGEGKCPTMEGGLDICLFDVAAGEGIYVEVWERVKVWITQGNPQPI